MEDTRGNDDFFEFILTHYTVQCKRLSASRITKLHPNICKYEQQNIAEDKSYIILIWRLSNQK